MMGRMCFGAQLGKKVLVVRLRKFIVRLLATVQKSKSVYETNLFSGVLKFIKDNSVSYDERSAKIVADHFRTSVFIISDGVVPSNTGRGYILRRLIRRVLTKVSLLELPGNFS